MIFILGFGWVLVVLGFAMMIRSLRQYPTSSSNDAAREQVQPNFDNEEIVDLVRQVCGGHVTAIEQLRTYPPHVRGQAWVTYVEGLAALLVEAETQPSPVRAKATRDKLHSAINASNMIIS